MVFFCWKIILSLIFLQPCKPSMGRVFWWKDSSPEAKAAKSEKKKADKEGVLKGWAWELKMAQASRAWGLCMVCGQLWRQKKGNNLGVETQKSFTVFGNLVCVFWISKSWKKMSCLKCDKDWKVASLFQGFQVLWLVCLANVPRHPKLN